MLKKSLLSLAVSASLVGLTGCNISSTTDNAGNKPAVQIQNEDVQSNGVYPLFNAAGGVVPLGSDFVFASAATSDGTIETGLDGLQTASPVTDALDDSDAGISTLAPIDVLFSGSIDEASVVAGQTVYLVKLPNAEDAAALTFPEGASLSDFEVLDLSTISPLFDSSVVAGNLGAIVADQPVAGTDYAVSVVSLDGTDDNNIRITPLKPLDSKSKYIVLVTNGVTAGGTAITSSPDYAAAVGTDALVSSALQPVRDLLQGLESLGAAIITAGGQNTAAAATLAPGIAYTAALTTGDPDKVLKAMAYPGTWAASDVVLNNATVAAGLQATAIAAGLTTQEEVDGLKLAFQSVDNSLALAENADRLEILATSYLLNGALTAPIVEGGATAYESPRARSFQLIENAGGAGVDQLPLVALNSATAALGGTQVLVSQGAIELPQYTETLLSDSDSIWRASTTVGGVLDGLAGNDLGTTPPTDVNGSTNTTYRYPFASEQRKATVPVLFIEPTVSAKATAFAASGAVDSGCTKPADGWPVIISQHGFTVDRAGTLLMGAQLAINTCSVVVAMDLPHHGIAPVGSDRNGNEITNSRLGLTLEYTNADVAAAPASFPFAAAAKALAEADEDSILNNLQERHEGLYLDATQTTQAMTYGETKAGESGDYFIRLTNFQRTRDNLRQAVMDLLNLNATLTTMDVDGDAAADLDIDNVSYVGHSLGGIVGTTFVAVNNDETVQLASAVTQTAAIAATSGSLTETQYDAFYTLPKIQAAVLATPGGGLTKLLENSQSIAPAILAGLSVAAGIQQGDDDFASFMKVLQNTVDSGDPMNFVSDLAEGGSSETPTMLIEMIGGGSIAATDADADLDAEADANGDGDNVDSQLPDTLIALGVYPADTVVPNNTTSSTVETARMPLAGTDPMIDLLGSTVVDTAGANQVQSYPVTQFNAGTHGTFSSADAVAAFTEMVTQVATFIGSGGAAITVANDSLLGTPAE